MCILSPSFPTQQQQPPQPFEIPVDSPSAHPQRHTFLPQLASRSTISKKGRSRPPRRRSPKRRRHRSRHHRHHSSQLAHPVRQLRTALLHMGRRHNTSQPRRRRRRLRTFRHLPPRLGVLRLGWFPAPGSHPRFLCRRAPEEVVGLIVGGLGV